jgi:DNA-binding Lrp family transcriptional regulator
MPDVKDRSWTSDGDATLRMYLEDGVAVSKIAEDFKRSEEKVRERIELLLERGELDTVDFNEVPDYDPSES